MNLGVPFFFISSSRKGPPKLPPNDPPNDIVKFWGAAPDGFFENLMIFDDNLVFFTSFGVRLLASSSKIPCFLKVLGLGSGQVLRKFNDL